MGRTDLDAAKRQLRDSGLAFPPVPDELASAFENFGPWNWGTRNVDPYSMYIFEHFASAGGTVVVPRDYVALCHAGHGANSYALTYHLVDSPVAILFQVGWGGVYSDATLDAERFRRLCDLSASAVDLSAKVRDAKVARVDVGSIQFSELGEFASFEIVRTTEHDGNRRPSREQISTPATLEQAYEAAHTWLSAQI